MPIVAHNHELQKTGLCCADGYQDIGTKPTAYRPGAGEGLRQDQGPGARRFLVASKCDELGAGFQGRQTPLVDGVQGRAKSPPGRGPAAKRSVWEGFGRGGNASS